MLSPHSSRVILTGDDVRLSIAAKIALSSLNPWILRPKASIPSFNATFTYSGNISLRLLKAVSPLKTGDIVVYDTNKVVEFEHEGKKYLVIDINNILVIL